MTILRILSKQEGRLKMMSLQEIFSRIKYWNSVDRIGPDILLTHWRLYFKSTMKSLCIKKFKYFGEGSEFRPGAYAAACSKISIGNNVVIRPGSFLYADPSDGGGSITIEDKVSIGSGVHFYTNNHKFSDSSQTIYDQGYPDPTENDSIILKKGCWVGAAVIILPGVTVGENAVVGAGSVVTKNIPAFTVACGNPAKVIRSIKEN
jgi:acetyltransferase-like isoleucine patch superfamily enzyme